MKSSQSNFNLRSPGSYLVRSYLITTVLLMPSGGGNTSKRNHPSLPINLES